MFSVAGVASAAPSPSLPDTSTLDRKSDKCLLMLTEYFNSNVHFQKTSFYTCVTGGPGESWLTVTNGRPTLWKATFSIPAALPPAGWSLWLSLTVLTLVAIAALATVGVSVWDTLTVGTSGAMNDKVRTLELWGCVCFICGIFHDSDGIYETLGDSSCGWFTYSSDRDSVLSSGHRKPCRVPGGNHTLLRSLLLLCMFPRHRRCRSGTLAEHHRSGNGRKRREMQFFKLNQRMRGVTYICRVRNYGFKQTAVFSVYPSFLLCLPLLLFGNSGLEPRRWFGHCVCSRWRPGGNGQARDADLKPPPEMELLVGQRETKRGLKLGKKGSAALKKDDLVGSKMHSPSKKTSHSVAGLWPCWSAGADVCVGLHLRCKVACCGRRRAGVPVFPDSSGRRCPPPGWVNGSVSTTPLCGNARRSPTPHCHTNMTTGFQRGAWGIIFHFYTRWEN